MKAGVDDLVRRLAEAEGALSEAVAGAVDAVVHPEGWTYLLRDAQEALLKSEAQAKEHAAVLHAILASAPDYLCEIDPSGTIRFANRVFADAIGTNVVGRSWIEFAPAELRPELERALDAVLQSGEHAEFEATAVRPDGTTGWYSTRMGPVERDGQRVGAVVVSRDITPAKQAEAQMVVSDRMASIGTLAASVAHEVNNPLASVLANLELLQRRLECERPWLSALEDDVALLRDAREGVERIRQIVRDIKLFSRPGDEKRSLCDVHRVLESTLRMAWNEIRHRATVQKCYGNVAPLFAQEARLGQVFLNLVLNAAQALPEGRVSENSIRVSTAMDAQGRVVVSISDTGPGVSPEVKARLFTPFFTTKPVGMGTGLGLSICYRIVKSLDGEILVDSELGRGTTFHVVLPAAPTNVAKPETVAPPAAPSSRRGRVLIVDDDWPIGNAFRRMLAPREVVSVIAARDALKLLETGERFDVILCDLMMPDMTGMDLFAELTVRFPAHARRMVFVSAGAFTQRAREFVDSVPNAFIEKPVEWRKLIDVVEEYCR